MLLPWSRQIDMSLKMNGENVGNSRGGLKQRAVEGPG